MKAIKNISLRVVVYHVIIIGIFQITPLIFYLTVDQDPRLLSMIILLSAFTPFYILNITVLIPRFLNKGKYVLYFSFLGFTLILAYFIVTLLFQLNGSFSIENLTPINKEFINRKYPPPFIVMPLIIYYALGISFESIIETLKQKRIKEEALKEKVNAELLFLKSQINPHFLFNSLNSIYSLSTSKSELTNKAILLLSDMMRYMLYESNGSMVPLTKEISHIENYIALQRLRISKKNNISIRFNCTGKPNGHMVEPLLFIPFVENAFKHGISYNETSIIDINLKIHHDKLIFETLNSCPKSNGIKLDRPKNEASGIGLNNIERRLNLLYPNRYQLKYNEGNELFCTKLEVNLV